MIEGLILEVNPQLSIHYWDWTRDLQKIPNGGAIVNLFSEDFTGSATGQMGKSWSLNHFYDVTASQNRSNPANPPSEVTLAVKPDPVVTGDNNIIGARNFIEFHNLMVKTHDKAHSHIGGTLHSAHISFRDPFVYLLHSNIDSCRILLCMLTLLKFMARGPTLMGSGGVGGLHPQWDIRVALEPWAGDAAQIQATTGRVENAAALQPWTAPENLQNLPENRKDSKHPTIINHKAPMLTSLKRTLGTSSGLITYPLVKLTFVQPAFASSHVSH